MEKWPGGGTSTGTWGKGRVYPASEREGDKRGEKERNKRGLNGKGSVVRRQLKLQL
jgi:hypothetical protein